MPTPYRYQPGDRPLDGFTLRAPAGRGGFGEVYFAESDAGREVALKALYAHQENDKIELRGIQHCMNLKSPHLVSIFDVKTGHDGTPFVVMEYVAGPSLRDLLNDAPGGLGPDKAAFFLREVAKGLSHLHGYGVVHRDLKPANIFYEDGYVKIGDYGLSKLMSAEAQASQTVTVGTVHYMAPEIGAGKYDKSIDLYALGCLLYELLTGKVPYRGASPTEVLMKHLQAQPNLDDVPQPFARVIEKALQKDPNDRYATAAEMVEDLFGEDHVRNSVSQLNAAELSTYAARVGRKVADWPTDTTPTALPPAAQRTPTPDPPTPISESLFAPIDWRQQIHSKQGYFVAVGFFATLASGIAALCADINRNSVFFSSLIFLMIAGPLVGWVVHKNKVFAQKPSFAYRVTSAIPPVVAHFCICIFLSFVAYASNVFEYQVDRLAFAGLVSAIVCAFVYWPRYTRPDRIYAFSPGMWICVGIAAALPALLNNPVFVSTAFALPVIIAVGAQVFSPVDQTTPPSTTHHPPPYDRPSTHALNKPTTAIVLVHVLVLVLALALVLIGTALLRIGVTA